MGAQFNGVTSVGHSTGSDLTGAVDTTQALIHFWIDPNGIDATTRYVFANNTAYCYVRVNVTTNKLAIQLKSSANVTLAYVLQTGALTALNGWTAVDVVVDTSAFVKLYINGVLEATGAAPTAGSIDWSRTNTFVGARTGLTEGFIGGIHQFAIWTSFTADYVSATGELSAKYFAEMYDLDSAGAIYPKETSIAAVTGAQPLILLENDYSTFYTNNGTSADLSTVTGTLLPMQTQPPYGTWTFTP